MPASDPWLILGGLETIAGPIPQARFRLAGRPQSARLQHRGPPTRRYSDGHFEQQQHWRRRDM